MISLKKKRGQTSAEFVIIAGVMFLIFIGMFMVIQGRMASANRDRLFGSMAELGNLVKTETRLADGAQGDYIRRFFLPTSIEGQEYTIEIDGNKEISIRVLDTDFVVFLDENVTGNISVGWNRINKTGNNISIRALS